MGQLGHEGHSFETVEGILANPYPPGTDPGAIRLPSVPRLRTPEDNEENHLLYWQAHLWETLLRYRRAFHHPACTDRLRAGYDEVAGTAVRLAERATSAFPLSPIDSVGCHSTLKELRAGARGLEATVEALADGSGAIHAPAGPGRPTDFTAVAATVASPATFPTPVPPAAAATVVGVDGPAAGGERGGDDDRASECDHAPQDGPPAAPLTPDLFAHPQAARTFDFKLSLRGARGLRRGRSLTGGGPAEPAARD